MDSKDNGLNDIRGCTLKGIRVFSKLLPAERDNIGKKMHKRVYSPKNCVIRAGDSGSDVYFLVSGRVRASSLSISGKAVQFEELHEGAMFGEWAALDSLIDPQVQDAKDLASPADTNAEDCNVYPTTRANDCEVIKSSVVVSMSCGDFIDCIHQYPSVCQAVLGRQAELARNANRLLYEAYVYRMPQRVRAELVRIAKSYTPEENGDIVITENITHDQIAQRIGAHREGVTIEINNLTEEKTITWTRQEHIIHSIEKLKDE